MKKREFSRVRGAPTRTHCTGRVFPLIWGGTCSPPIHRDPWGMCSPTLHRPSFHTCLRSAARLAAHVLAGPCAAAMDVDSLSVQLEELRAANGGRLPGCKKLAAACGISQREAKELLQQLKLEQELADGESATKCARKRKAGEAVDAADTLPDRQPEDLDTQQDEVADVEVDSEAEALAAEADLEAGAHEAARVVAARKAADAQLAWRTPRLRRRRLAQKYAARKSRKSFVSRLFLGRKPAQPAAGDSACCVSLLHCALPVVGPCRPWPVASRCCLRRWSRRPQRPSTAWTQTSWRLLGRSHAPVCF